MQYVERTWRKFCCHLMQSGWIAFSLTCDRRKTMGDTNEKRCSAFLHGYDQQEDCVDTTHDTGVSKLRIVR